MTSFDQAAYSPTGAGTMAMGFGPHQIRIPATQTGGRLGVFESELAPGEGPPMHVHDREDEFFRVLEGRFAFWCNGVRVDLDAGGLIVVPRGSVHRFMNIGETSGRVMIVVTPGGFEGFFGSVEAENPSTPQEIDSLAARYHLRFTPALAAAMA
ncbi:cupin domain-containing protein [Paracoccus aestuariivivens]|uniref:Cupin domain-containing protein n=1 Tax=Paracoccus aestuariivivens TaxID=1820333 RepID=A0A6L6J6W7_9RHOB|nr:cupin domain-containing protein [Paracoccus aestuariivivens]MTH77853.1 cupin domain-containing protein [Paracoccus aestuariivivens]